MKYIIYQTLNTINNKIYVGVHKTKDPEVFDGYIGCGIRINMPSSYNNPTTPLQFAVNKYGTKAFKRSTLYIFDTPEEAYAEEARLVNKDFIRRTDTYNAKLGGSWFTKVYQFTLDGTFVKMWDAIIDASDFYGVSHTAILQAAKFKGSCKRFFWSYVENPDLSEYTSSVGTTCYQYDSNGHYCNTYNSYFEAMRDNDISEQSLSRAIKGGYNLKGFYYSTKLLEEYNGKPKVSLKGKSIYVYSLDGEFITELKNSTEIYEFFNIKSTHAITTALRTERPYKQYQISLEHVLQMPKVINKRNISKPVECYDLYGNLIEEFKSITEAVKKYGTGVQKVLRGQQQVCKEHIFQYKS